MKSLKRAIVELVRDVRAAFQLEFSPRLPPWSRLARDNGAVSQLRYRATRIDRLSGASRKARVKILLVSVLWPLKATVEGFAQALKYGARVKAISGIGVCRQWYGAMSMAHRWNFSPKTYYVYRLWDPAIRPQNYIQIHELLMLQLHIIGDADTQTISNKRVFAARCKEAGLPTPTLVATFTRTGTEWTSEPSLPHCDLFVKRVNGMQGAGGERWIYSDEKWSRKDRTLTAPQLVQHLSQLAQRHAVLLQRCLQNHSDLSRYSLGPVCTFRVMTYRGDHDSPTLLGATFKIPRSGSDVDNIHAGGIACAIDAETGELSAGISRDPGEALWHEHPEGRGRIAGTRLTTHQEVIRLALAAHRVLDVPWSVGWDVAMTPDGPVLVEGNALWGVDLFHAPYRSGLPINFANRLLQLVRPP
jgi:hypothetical protein